LFSWSFQANASIIP